MGTPFDGLTGAAFFLVMSLLMTEEDELLRHEVCAAGTSTSDRPAAGLAMRDYAGPTLEHLPLCGCEIKRPVPRKRARHAARLHFGEVLKF